MGVLLQMPIKQTTERKVKMSDETSRGGNTSQMYKHEDVYEWLLEEGIITPKSTGPEIIAAFAARRNDYRKTDRYEQLIESHKAEQEAAAEAERERKAAEREARAAEREKEAAEKKAKAEKAADKGKEKPTAKKGKPKPKPKPVEDDDELFD